MIPEEATFLTRFTASITCLASGGEKLAPISTPLASDFGNFGLPIFALRESATAQRRLPPMLSARRRVARQVAKRRPLPGQRQAR